MVKIFKKNNYIVVGALEFLRTDIEVRKNELDGKYYIYYNSATENRCLGIEAIPNILDEADNPYTQTAWENFYTSNTGPLSSIVNSIGVNGTTPYKLITAASTNANVVKTSGGNIYSIVAIGLTSTVRFLKLYNKASAPTVGTDTPVMTIPIPANTQGAGIAIPFSVGINFPLGIAISVTSGSADNDSVAIGAGDVLINLTFA